MDETTKAAIDILNRNTISLMDQTLEDDTTGLLDETSRVDHTTEVMPLDGGEAGAVNNEDAFVGAPANHGADNSAQNGGEVNDVAEGGELVVEDVGAEAPLQNNEEDLAEPLIEVQVEPENQEAAIQEDDLVVEEDIDGLGQLEQDLEEQQNEEEEVQQEEESLQQEEEDQEAGESEFVVDENQGDPDENFDWADQQQNQGEGQGEPPLADEEDGE